MPREDGAAARGNHSLDFESIMIMDSHSYWSVQETRLTAFSAAPIGAEAGWRDLFGEDPPQSTRKAGIIEEQGPWENGLMVCAQGHGRLDWRWQVLRETDPQPELPVLGALDETMTKFSRLVQGSFLRNVESVTRVALGAKLAHQVSRTEEAYEALQHFLPAINMTGASDLTFQINRPVEDSSWGLVNCLAKWAVVREQFFLMRVAATPPSSTPAVERFYSSMEIDVNTRQDRHEPLPPGTMSGVWALLSTHAMRLAVHGERSN